MEGKSTDYFYKLLALVSDSSVGKESACNAGDADMWVGFLGQEDPLEEEMVTHSSILAWRIHGQRSLVGNSPWGHKRVRHN